MTTYSCILAWRIPWTEEPGGLQSIGSQRVGHDWSNLAGMHALDLDSNPFSAPDKIFGQITETFWALEFSLSIEVSRMGIIISTSKKLWALCFISFNKKNTTTSQGASGKESACQCRRCRFNPSARKIPWRGKWQPAPVFLPEKSHGLRSQAGYSPWGSKELDMTEQLSVRTHAHTHIKI